MSRPVFVDELPVWDGSGYLHPMTGAPLATWEEAIAELEADPEAKPAHVMRFGPQTDVKGLIAGLPETDRAVRYLTKYLTKALAETYADDEHPDAAYEAHIERLHREVRFLPCSPDCANWLRFGVQPRRVVVGLIPGRCPSKAHDRTSGWAGGVSSSPVAGRESGSRTTVPTVPRRCARPSRSPGSTCPRRTGWQPRSRTRKATTGSNGRRSSRAPRRRARSS